MGDLYHESSLSTADDGIRLIEIDDGRLHLRNYTFDQAPEYITLSYAWSEATDNQADDSNTVLIYVRDIATEIGLQPNLWLFIERARKNLPRHTFLWIDAICINQADIPERNYQVSLMKEIYSRAILTIVWLGESSHGTYDVSYLHPSRLTEGDPQLLFPPWGSDTEKPSVAEYSSWIAKYGPRYASSDLCVSTPEKLHNAWIVLDAMCRRNYWTRLWVVQEFTLSKRICIWVGNNLLQLRDFVSAIYKLFCLEQSDERMQWEDAFAKARFTSPGLSPVLDLCIARCNPTYGTDLSPTFESTFNALSASRQCTEHLDSVYALLSLCREPVTPDYAKSPSNLFWEMLELPANRDCVKLGQQLADKLHLPESGEEFMPRDMDTPRFTCVYDDWNLDNATSYFSFADDKIKVYSFFKSGLDGTRSEQLHIATRSTLEPSSLRIRHLVGTVLLLLFAKDSEVQKSEQYSGRLLGVAVIVSLRRYELFFPAQRSARLKEDTEKLGTLLDYGDKTFKDCGFRTIQHTNDQDGKVLKPSIMLNGRELGLAIFCRSYAFALKYGRKDGAFLGLPELPDDDIDSNT